MKRLNKFELWLFEEPWRLERYYDMVPGYTQQDKLKLIKEYHLNHAAK